MFLLFLGFVFKMSKDSLINVNSKVIHIACSVYFFVQRSNQPQIKQVSSLEWTILDIIENL